MTGGLDSRAAEIVRDQTLAATEARALDAGKVYAWLTPNGGVHQIDLTGDQWREFPQRKRGTVTVRDVAAFQHYYERHADDNSEVFADLGAGTVTAVLDAHRSLSSDAAHADAARWQQHRLILQLQKTQTWRTWTDPARHRQFMPQADFAEFIEDNATDVDPHGDVTAGDLLDIGQFFQAHTEVAFTQGTRLKDGQTQLQWQETVSASTRTSAGQLEIPSEFTLAIAPYEDCSDKTITVRLRYRLVRPAVKFAYVLSNPERREQDAVAEIAAKVATELGVTVMHGTPAPPSP